MLVNGILSPLGPGGSVWDEESSWRYHMPNFIQRSLAASAQRGTRDANNALALSATYQNRQVKEEGQVIALGEKAE